MASAFSAITKGFLFRNKYFPDILGKHELLKVSPNTKLFEYKNIVLQTTLSSDRSVKARESQVIRISFLLILTAAVIINSLLP